MIYENYKQLQGKAGAAPGEERRRSALSHNIGGAPQACGIAIIGRD